MKSLNVSVSSIGQLFANPTLTQNVVTQLIAPSANLNGAVIRTLTANLIGGGTAQGLNIFADTVVPANVADFTKRVIFSQNTTTAVSGTLPYELFLYPGMGMWVGTGSNAGATVFLTYDLLSPE